MAFGQHFITPTVLDTASDPDDTSIFAAQGAGQVAYIRWLMITVETPQSGSKIVIENGAGGAGVVITKQPAVNVKTASSCWDLRILFKQLVEDDWV